MSSLPLLLVVESGEIVPVKTESIGEGELFTLGRGKRSSWLVASPSVARTHAVIEKRDGGHYLRDMGSTNGTCVNGRLIDEPVRLKSGDEIQLAEIAFRYFEGTDAEQKCAAARERR